MDGHDPDPGLDPHDNTDGNIDFEPPDGDLDSVSEPDTVGDDDTDGDDSSEDRDHDDEKPAENREIEDVRRGDKDSKGMQTDATNDSDDERDTDDNRDTDPVDGATPAQASPQVSPPSSPNNDNVIQQPDIQPQTNPSPHRQQPTTPIIATQAPEHARTPARQMTNTNYGSHDRARTDAGRSGTDSGTSTNPDSNASRDGTDNDSDEQGNRPTSSNNSDSKEDRNAVNASMSTGDNHSQDRKIANTPSILKKRARFMRTPPSDGSPSQAPPPPMRPRTGDSASEPEGPALDDQQHRFDNLIGGDPPTNEHEIPLGRIPLCSGPFLFGRSPSSNHSSSDNSLGSED